MKKAGKDIGKDYKDKRRETGKGQSLVQRDEERGREEETGLFLRGE